MMGKYDVLFKILIQYHIKNVTMKYRKLVDKLEFRVFKNPLNRNSCS